MAHVQGKYARLWKPQELSVDKIDSQKIFVDNIDALEAFALSVLKRIDSPVMSIDELRSINTSDTSIYVDGMTVMVKSNGLYFFDRANVSQDNGTTIIAPTTGGGRWISDHTFFGSLAFKDSITKSDVGLGNVPNVATNDQTPTFTQASTLANIASGEKVSTLFGKIMKAIADLISHLANKSNPHSVTKTQVGLGNVDNTSDINKPISNAQATAIADAKKAGTDANTNLNVHANNTSNPHSVTKTQVGLGNVPNVATNDQTPTFTQASTLANIASGEKVSTLFGKIMKAIADLISHLANKSNPHAVTKAQVGLGNVDNTSDINKPVSTAMQAALDGKASVINGEIPTESYLRLTGFAILQNTNLNDIKYSGQYGVMSSCTNRPTGTSLYDMLEVIMYSTHWLIQRYYVLGSNGIISGVYYRSYTSDSTWSPWKLYNINNTVAAASIE